MANPTGWKSEWGTYQAGVNDFSTQMNNANTAADRAAVEAARNSYIDQQSGGTGTITDSAGHSYSKTYGSNTDYNAAIQNAVSNNESSDYINMLNAERNAKIAASNGTLDKYANDTQSIVDAYTSQMQQQKQDPQITALQSEIDNLKAYIEKVESEPKAAETATAAETTTQQNTDATEYLKQIYAAQKEQELANLKTQYNQSRNNIAAQSALSNNMFNEQAIASGLNTGTSGQAALARSATQRSNLANLDATYLEAINNANTEGDSALAQALYQELVRQQNLEAQKQAEENELALAYAKIAAQQDTSNTPTLTAAQAYTAYKNGLRTQEVLEAYDYYYGTDYANGGTANATQETQNTDKVSYNNGSLTKEQIKNLQRRLNTYLDANNQISVDGYWGPATKAAANGMSADDYYEAVYIENTRNKNLGAR